MTTSVEVTTSEITEPDVIGLTIPGSVRFVRLARIAVASLARRKGMSVRTIDDLRLAVDESFALLLREEDRPGTVDVTFEVDDHELAVVIVQRFTDGPLGPNDEDLVRFEVVIEDLVDRFEADTENGVVQFSKLI